MSAPTVRKSAAKKTASSRRTVRGNSDARDAVLREAERAANDGARTHLTSVNGAGQQTRRVAAKRDVKQFASGLNDKYLDCRDGGHKYRTADYTPIGRGGAFSRRKYCPNCKLDIFQSFDRDGNMVEQKVRYPDGYLAEGVGFIGKDTKGQMRVESFKRAMAKQGENGKKAAAS